MMLSFNLEERIIELYNEYSGEPSFWDKIVREIEAETGESFTRDAIRGRWRRLQKKKADEGYTEYVEDDGTQYETVKEGEDTTRSHEACFSGSASSVDEFLTKYNVDRELYDVERFVVNEWADYNQIKATLVKKKTQPIDEESFLSKIEEVVLRHKSKPIAKYNPTENTRGRYLFVPVIFDAHVDSVAFRHDYNETLERLVNLGISAGYLPSRCLFIVGNDFGHIDNANSETTGGTRVSAKQTYLDSIDSRCSTLLQASDYLRSISEKLDILPVPGNHDRFSTYWLAKVLGAYYTNSEDVGVLDNQNPRKYYRYGKTLFGFTHGSDEKQTDMVGLMAAEAPIEWAATKNRIWMTGHIHQQRRTFTMLNEKFGVIQRIFPSLVESDDWHILKGYIGNDRAAQLLIYDLDGPVGEFHLSLR